jgi:hypothetical protein
MRADSLCEAGVAHWPYESKRLYCFLRSLPPAVSPDHRRSAPLVPTFSSTDSKERRWTVSPLYPGHPDQCTPWHYLERDGGRRMITRVLVKVWTHRHPDTTSADLAVLLTLAAHAGPDTTVELDYEALAAKTGTTLQEATAAVERLLERRDLQPAGDRWVAVSLNGATT